MWQETEVPTLQGCCTSLTHHLPLPRQHEDPGDSESEWNQEYRRRGTSNKDGTPLDDGQHKIILSVFSRTPKNTSSRYMKHTSGFFCFGGRNDSEPKFFSKVIKLINNRVKARTQVHLTKQQEQNLMFFWTHLADWRSHSSNFVYPNTSQAPMGKNQGGGGNQSKWKIYSDFREAGNHKIIK